MSYGTHPPAFSVNTELHVFYCCWSVAKSCPTFCDSMGCSTPGSLSSTISQSFLKFTSFKSVMLSNHLTLCRPLFLLLSIFPASGFFFFPSELALHIKWPRYWSFGISISPSSEYSGLISLRIDWFDLFAVQGTLKSLLQHHSSKASVLRCSDYFMFQSHICT